MASEQHGGDSGGAKSAQSVSAWLGFAIIALGLLAMGLFAHYHVEQGTTAGGVVTLGVAVVWAKLHERAQSQLQTTRIELKNLRASIRPPSLVDAEERKPTP